MKVQKLAFALMLCALGSALADPPETNPLDLGVAEVEALGTLNGLALACRDFAGSKAVKDLVIRLVPKTRRFGIVFESATNAAFLAQSQSREACPSDGSSSRKISTLRHNHMTSIGKSGKAAGRPTAYKALAVCLGK